MSPLAILAIALVIFLAGGAGGIKWHAGQDAIIAQKAAAARELDSRKQIRIADKAATNHASELAQLNNQLGDAREKIARLSDRKCFDASTARMLNTIGSQPLSATSSEPTSAPNTAASGSGLRFTTERDAAGYIALCRARYAEVASQVNQILDIEEQRK